jgi:hypothetical protein
MSKSKPTRHSAFIEDEEERRWASRPWLTCEQHVKCAASLQIQVRNRYKHIQIHVHIQTKKQTYR